jgi:hypothetical protein
VSNSVVSVHVGYSPFYSAEHMFSLIKPAYGNNQNFHCKFCADCNNDFQILIFIFVPILFQKNWKMVVDC